MQHLLAQLVAGRPLTLAQALEAFDLIMTGKPTPTQVGALLALIQARGPTEDEIVGAATIMRDKVTRVDVPAGLTVIDTCGTGGTHSKSFNISTAAGLVAAAVGRRRNVAVAKHGNRAVTSASGSSQVLAALGVKLQVSLATLSRCLDEAGFCFCFAPAHHPAMRFAAPIRADLGFRTIFNLLGPLTNPAGARRQLMGVASLDLTEPIARVLLRLGSEHAMVVHGRMSYDRPESGEEKAESGAETAAGGEIRGLGELTTTGPTRISQVAGGRVRTYELDARELGLAAADPRDLQVDSPEASAALIRRVLKADAASRCTARRSGTWQDQWQLRSSRQT